MRKKYHAPSKEFFRLPNQIFDVPMTPIQFTIYAYLVCCAGSKGYPWLSQHYSKAQKTTIYCGATQRCIHNIWWLRIKIWLCSRFQNEE